MEYSKEKQIEEITKIICRSNTDGICGYDGHPCDFNCGSYQLATILYNADYRLASDVAEEIFAEIDKTIADLEYLANTPRKTVKVEELKEQVNWVLHEVVPKTLAELKKKYESEKDNG